MSNIDPNLASIILNRNIQKLREGFNLLENLGMVRDKTKINYNINQNKYMNYNQKKYQPNNNIIIKSNNVRANSGQFRQNYTNEPRQINSGQSRRDYYNNSSSNITRQNRQNIVQPMEVDHIQHEVNFQTTPHRFTYR